MTRDWLAEFSGRRKRNKRDDGSPRRRTEREKRVSTSSTNRREDQNVRENSCPVVGTTRRRVDVTDFGEGSGESKDSDERDAESPKPAREASESQYHIVDSLRIEAGEGCEGEGKGGKGDSLSVRTTKRR
jgi:hypothetical protein